MIIQTVSNEILKFLLKHWIVSYDTVNCIEYSYLVLHTIYFSRSKFCPSEVWHIAIAIDVAITIANDVDVAVMQDCHSQIARLLPDCCQIAARLLPDCKIARLPDCQIARSYVQGLTMVCSPFKWSICVLKKQSKFKTFQHFNKK